MTQRPLPKLSDYKDLEDFHWTSGAMPSARAGSLRPQPASRFSRSAITIARWISIITPVLVGMALLWLTIVLYASVA